MSESSKTWNGLVVPPGQRVRLAKLDCRGSGWRFKRARAEREVAALTQRMAELQYRLYAENRRSVLVVLQAMDAGGKDGTIRHVFGPINPQGCQVTSFKVPSAAEAAHDFLWRIHAAVPAHGKIGIFNRSHYEDVLVVRVRELQPESVWRRRFDQINAFEELLADAGTTILKFFLHISPEEQKKRIMARMNDPAKNWKLSPADISERKFWDAYQAAFEDALARCSTARAPWFVIPADRKWIRNLLVSRIVCEALERMDPKLPDPPTTLDQLKFD